MLVVAGRSNTDIVVASTTACCARDKRVNRLLQVAGAGLRHVGQGEIPVAHGERAVGEALLDDGQSERPGEGAEEVNRGPLRGRHYHHSNNPRSAPGAIRLPIREVTL